MFPQIISKSITKNEKILFKSKKIIDKRTVNVVWIITTGFFLILIVSLLGLFENFLFRLFSNPFTCSLIILLFTVTFVGGYFMSRSYIHKTFFLITDKKIYLLSKESRFQTVERYALDSIVAVDINRRKLDNKNHGTIKLIFKSDYVRKIRNIPDFTQFQRFFESILYHFGNFGKNFDEITYKIPLAIKLSQNRLNQIKISIIRNYITLVAIPVVDIVIIIIVNLSISDSFVILFVNIMSFSMVPLFLTLPIINIILMRKRRSNTDKTLTFDSNSAFLENFSNLQLEFNLKTTIRFLKTLKPGSYFNEWSERLDTLWIKPSFDSKEGIRYGPIENLTKIFEFTQKHLIKWKGDKNLLLDKAKLQSEFEHTILLGEDKSNQYEEYKSDSQIRMTYLEDIRSSVMMYLNPEEKIKFEYKPKISLHSNYLYIFFGLLIGILAFIFFNPFTSTNFLIFIPFIFSLMIPIMCCCTNLSTLSGKLLIKNSTYIFTNQKLIFNYRQKYCLITYKNIHSISYQKKPLKAKYQSIMLNLENSVENNPYINNKIIIISHIPKGSNLLSEIEKLIEIVK